jgi:hypothetical protein
MLCQAAGNVHVSVLSVLVSNVTVTIVATRYIGSATVNGAERKNQIVWIVLSVPLSCALRDRREGVPFRDLLYERANEQKTSSAVSQPQRQYFHFDHHHLTNLLATKEVYQRKTKQRNTTNRTCC